MNWENNFFPFQQMSLKGSSCSKIEGLGPPLLTCWKIFNYSKDKSYWCSVAKWWLHLHWERLRKKGNNPEGDYFKFDAIKPYFMAYCIESLPQPFFNSIGDGNIWTPDPPSTSLSRYQLSWPEWNVCTTFGLIAVSYLEKKEETFFLKHLFCLQQHQVRLACPTNT